MANPNERHIIGTYFLPVAVAEALIEDSEDLEEVLGDDLSYDVDQWLESLPGLQNKEFIAVTGEKQMNVAHALFNGHKVASMEVMVIASLSNMDWIRKAYLVKPTEMAELAKSFPGAVKSQNPNSLMCTQELLNEVADTFPVEGSLKQVIDWARFGTPMNQVLLSVLIQDNLF